MINTDNLTPEEATTLSIFRRIGLPEVVVNEIFEPTQRQSCSGRVDKYEPLSDEEFDILRPFLTDAPQASIPLRDFLNAVLWMLCNKRPWTEIPDKYGDSDAIRQRFTRMALKRDTLTALAGHVCGRLSDERQTEIEQMSAYAVRIAARRSQATKVNRL